MKKIIFMMLSFVLCVFALTACGNETTDEPTDEPKTPTIEAPETFTVMWKNYNGEVLEVDNNVEKGTTPSYDGSIPLKESDENYDYAFVGWTPTISPVTSNISYVAYFKAVEKSEDIPSIVTYTITWINENGDVLEVDENVEAGTTPTYDGSTPTKESDEQYDYTFAGWTPVISEVSGNMTYKAIFTASEIVVKEKVYVIVLAGQSNAVGQSYAYHLSDEDLAKYKEGYENVQIRYQLNPFSETETKHVNTAFEPVKVGQGKGVDWTKYPDGCIGPELGLAEYLSANYPDEQFYIIKSATGGTTLHDRWYSTSSLEYLGLTDFADNSLYVKLLDFVDENMQILEKQYEPEIISFCWMQGENDAKDYSADYEVLWSNLIKDLKNEWNSYLPENGLSVIDAGITNYWTNFDVINAVKEKYAALSNKNYYIDVVMDSSITAFKDNTDFAHLDAYAMLKLGQEFGKNVVLAYENLDKEEVVYDVPKYANEKWNGIDISTSLQGEGTVENPYLINSEADMAYFALSVETNDYANKYVKLTVDLDMSNYAFKGIGYGTYNADAKKYDTNPFAGTFDGDNHTVKVNIVKDFVSGLFAAVSGTVKNVNVSGSIRCVYRSAGAIAGIQLGGLIENCTNNAIVTSKYYTAGNGNVGGIVGYMKAGNIKDCTNNGDVYGYVNLYTDNQGVGGIVGTIVDGATGTITGCTNNGFVYNKGYCTGGIIGVNRGKYTISDCTNTATVTGEKSLVGGIMGVTNFSANTIEECSNSGNITGATFVGGIIGSLGYDGDRASTVRNCTNSGDIKATKTTATIGKDVKAGSRVGGIAGMAYGSTVENCTNTGNVTCPNTPESLSDWQNAEPYIGLLVGFKTTNAKVLNSDQNTEAQ